MLVRAKTTFHSSYHGEIQVGRELEVDGQIAGIWLDAGMVEAVQVVKTYYNTKVIGDQPQVGAVPLESGLESESSSSPAAPASRKKTATNSKAKKP